VNAALRTHEQPAARAGVGEVIKVCFDVTA
jgi:hypothetical protein